MKTDPIRNLFTDANISVSKLVKTAEIRSSDLNILGKNLKNQAIEKRIEGHCLHFHSCYNGNDIKPPVPSVRYM